MGDRNMAHLGNGHKGVLMLSGNYSVNRNLDGTVGGILKANWARHTRRELTVNLRLSGAGTNCAPRNKLVDVLRRDHIQELGSRRHTHSVDIN